MKQSNNSGAISEDGWNALQKIALCGPKELRRWTVRVPAEESTSGRSFSLRMPRAKASFKSKFGALIVYYDIVESDMAAARLKLTPKAYECFSRKLYDQLRGMATLIEGASKVTCQVTGQLGAKRFRDHRGIVLTLHPTTIKDLKLRQWSGKP